MPLGCSALHKVNPNSIIKITTIITTTTIKIITITMGVMPRPVHGAPAFTEHRHFQFPDLCILINPYGDQ